MGKLIIFTLFNENKCCCRSNVFFYALVVNVISTVVLSIKILKNIYMYNSSHIKQFFFKLKFESRFTTKAASIKRRNTGVKQ